MRWYPGPIDINELFLWSGEMTISILVGLVSKKIVSWSRGRGSEGGVGHGDGD
jgi:hypothetical protein